MVASHGTTRTEICECCRKATGQVRCNYSDSWRCLSCGLYIYDPPPPLWYWLASAAVGVVTVYLFWTCVAR